MTPLVNRLIFFCAGACVSAGILAILISSAHREKEPLVERVGAIEGQLETMRSEVALERQTARQTGSSNLALKSALRESEAEIARLNAIIAQRKLLPIAVIRMKNKDSRFEYLLKNLGAEALEVYISVDNPERKRADPDYPKSRSLFQTLAAKQTLTFQGYAGDTLSIAGQGFANFKENYP